MATKDGRRLAKINATARPTTFTNTVIHLDKVGNEIDRTVTTVPARKLYTHYADGRPTTSHNDPDQQDTVTTVQDVPMSCEWCDEPFLKRKSYPALRQNGEAIAVCNICYGMALRCTRKGHGRTLGRECAYKGCVADQLDALAISPPPVRSKI